MQAGRHYFAAMCPLRLVARLFIFDEEEVQPEFRAQRTINRARIPEIARYIVDNPRGYVFSSITVSIDGQVEFKPTAVTDSGASIGSLQVPMSARFLINDGQHRRAAIAEALKERPELADETISVVFFIDAGLKRSQQMFADLNTHAVRATRTLGILYDHRDPLAELARRLAQSVPVFKGLTELERTNISNRSRKLFTLSSIYQATKRLLGKGRGKVPSSLEEDLARDFWTETAKHIPEWQAAARREVSSFDLRREYVHAHGIALHALAVMGSDLIRAEPQHWQERLKALEKLDWSRSNIEVWEGRAMIGGRVSKAHNNVLLTAALLKRVVGLPLSTDERRVEGVHGRAQDRRDSRRRTEDGSNLRKAN